MVRHGREVREALEALWSAETSEEDGLVAAALAAALPQLHNALPRDHTGACICPHPHPLVRREASPASLGYTSTGVPTYFTGRACDNCGGAIGDRFYWQSTVSNVDFCSRCYEETQSLLVGHDVDRILWAVAFVDSAARALLNGDASPLPQPDARLHRHSTPPLLRPARPLRRAWARAHVNAPIPTAPPPPTPRLSGADDSSLTVAGPPARRENFVDCLAFDWPPDLFEALVSAVVDVADAGVVHIEDNTTDITAGGAFW